jgi:hypothetical protein
MNQYFHFATKLIGDDEENFQKLKFKEVVQNDSKRIFFNTPKRNNFHGDLIYIIKHDDLLYYNFGFKILF